jgi:molecular chaperone GrpE (heat shock protein)
MDTEIPTFDELLKSQNRLKMLKRKYEKAQAEYEYYKEIHNREVEKYLGGPFEYSTLN